MLCFALLAAALVFDGRAFRNWRGRPAAGPPLRCVRTMPRIANSRCSDSEQSQEYGWSQVARRFENDGRNKRVRGGEICTNM
jgi:hypothetical protein